MMDDSRADRILLSLAVSSVLIYGTSCSSLSPSAFYKEGTTGEIAALRRGVTKSNIDDPLKTTDSEVVDIEAATGDDFYDTGANSTAAYEDSLDRGVSSIAERRSSSTASSSSFSSAEVTAKSSKSPAWDLASLEAESESSSGSQGIGSSESAYAPSEADDLSDQYDPLAGAESIPSLGEMGELGEESTDDPMLDEMEASDEFADGGLGAAGSEELLGEEQILEGIAIPGKLGYVRTPYTTPSRVIDVRGFDVGSQVRCPYSNKIFTVPTPVEAIALNDDALSDDTQESEVLEEESQSLDTLADMEAVEEQVGTDQLAAFSESESELLETEDSLGELEADNSGEAESDLVVAEDSPAEISEEDLSLEPTPEEESSMDAALEDISSNQSIPQETPEAPLEDIAPEDSSVAQDSGANLEDLGENKLSDEDNIAEDTASADPSAQGENDPSLAAASNAQPQQPPYGNRIEGQPGLVNSPYAEKHQIVNVQGLEPGVSVRCPYSGKIFRVPPLTKSVQ